MLVSQRDGNSSMIRVAEQYFALGIAWNNSRGLPNVSTSPTSILSAILSWQKKTIQLVLELIFEYSQRQFYFYPASHLHHFSQQICSLTSLRHYRILLSAKSKEAKQGCHGLRRTSPRTKNKNWENSQRVRQTQQTRQMSSHWNILTQTMFTWRVSIQVEIQPGTHINAIARLHDNPGWD